MKDITHESGVGHQPEGGIGQDYPGPASRAVALSTASRNTAVLDLDPQASAAKWADRRAAELPVVRSAHASRLRHELRQIQDADGELVMVDTAPHPDKLQDA